MSRIFDELSININSFGTFSAIVVLVFFIITFVLFSILFHKVILIRYSILLQVIMLLYLSIFLVITNSTNADVIFHLSRLMYVVFMFHSVASIYTISHIASENLFVLKGFSILSSFIIISLIYINDTFIITREIQVITYYSTVKGPLFPLAIIYILLIGIMMIINYFILYKKSQEDTKKLWPIFIGIIFFTFYIDFQGVLLFINPTLKPQLYLPTLVFLFLFLFYVFTEVKKTINDREKLYKAYLYDDLTDVYTRNFILEEISESISKKWVANQYVAMIDIDGFKKVNDTYGHILGDRVLRVLGELLNNINIEHTLPGRLGGDEFIIFFKDCQEQQVTEEINSLLRNFTFALTEMNVDVLKTQTGLSVGLITLESSMSLKDVLTLADKTMYDAKKNGKNTIRILAKSVTT